MKKLYLIISFCIIISGLNGQVLCIQCYDQNNRVSANVTNLIQNGSFEIHNCIPQNWHQSSFCPNSSFYNCDIDQWTCTGGGTDTYADVFDPTYSVVGDGQYGLYFGNYYANLCNPSWSDTSCISTSGCITTGIPAGYPTNTVTYGGNAGVNLSQTVSGLTAGNTYVLEFWCGGETNWMTDGVFAIDIGFGKIYLRNPETQSSPSTGRRFIVQFVADSSSHTFTFTNWGHVSGGYTELELDDVLLYPIKQLSSIIPACALNATEVAIDKNRIFFTNSDQKLHISMSAANRIEIYNTASQRVYASHDVRELDLSAWPVGIYFYQLDIEGSSHTGRFIKN